MYWGKVRHTVAMGLSMLVGCLLISNGPNIGAFMPARLSCPHTLASDAVVTVCPSWAAAVSSRVCQHAHLLIVLVFRCAPRATSFSPHATLGAVNLCRWWRSCFVWLLSILAVALLAWAIAPLRGEPAVLLPLGVLIQEYFRRVYFQGFAGMCRRLKNSTPSIQFTTEERLGIALSEPCAVPGLAMFGAFARAQRSRDTHARLRRAQRVVWALQFVTQ